MIKFALRCDEDHRFEGWFSGNADYNAQAEDGLLACPVCGSGSVEKAPMAPAIRTGRKADAAAEAKLAEVKRAVTEGARKARDYVHENFEGVGERFPEEARKIHYGEAEDRPIYGQATRDEAAALTEEGIGIAPVPQVPDEAPVDKKKLS